MNGLCQYQDTVECALLVSWPAPKSPRAYYCIILRNCAIRAQRETSALYTGVSVCMCRFVKFANEEPAKNSIVEVNGKYFQGAKLSVSALGPGLSVMCIYVCVEEGVHVDCAVGCLLVLR